MSVKIEKNTGKTYEIEVGLASDVEYQRNFSTVFDFHFASKKIEPFLNKEWRVIGIPYDLDGTNNTFYPRSMDLDFRFPTLHRDWLKTILESFQSNGTETVTMIGFHLGNVVRCEPDPDLLRNLYLSEFFCIEDIFIVDSSLKWGIRPSGIEATFVAAEPELMDSFFAAVGGESLVEYFFAICMNYERHDETWKALQWIYDSIDWEMPFEVEGLDRELSTEEFQQLIDKTELEICEHFGIDPSMRPVFTD